MYCSVCRHGDAAGRSPCHRATPLLTPLTNQAKAPKAGAAPAQPLAANNAQAAGNGKSIEQVYQKKTQLEHILLRPDTYIGSVEKQVQQVWVHDGTKMELRSINVCPGLYKIFDEILVNAADNKVRDPTMDCLKVTIDAVRRQGGGGWGMGGGGRAEWDGPGPGWPA